PRWQGCEARVPPSLTSALKCSSSLAEGRFTGRRRRPMQESPDQLRGRNAPWGTGASIALAALVAFGLWLRLRGLSAEGFGDDEVHKWLAANRYLHGVFSGDDVEHPMLMKWLIAGSIAIGSRLGWGPGAKGRLADRLGGGPPVVVGAGVGARRT